MKFHWMISNAIRLLNIALENTKIRFILFVANTREELATNDY